LTGETNRHLLLTNVSVEAAGDYTVVVTNAFGSFTSAVARVTVVVRPLRLFVALESPNPTPPFTNWATAAHVIQDAVEIAARGAEVLVTNGVYTSGGRNGNRVLLDKPLTLRSLNGPQFTVIQGYKVPESEGSCGLGDASIRCVYLNAEAVLSGFTLTNGATASGGDREVVGGGVYCGSTSAVVTNCVMVGNSAVGGGGASGGTFYNCTLADNWAGAGWKGGYRGGGAHGCRLYNCRLTGNRALYGGGAGDSVLYDCVLTGNSAGGEGGGANRCALYNCVLSGNWADSGTLYGGGGGAFGSTLYNCTVIGNSAAKGGGLLGWDSIPCRAFNCILYYNTAAYGPNFPLGTDPDSGSEPLVLLQYSCTSPLPTNGIGNITGPPLFMDMSAGDYRLREDSPCIDAGTSLVGFTMTITNADTGDVSILAYAHDPADILGNSRFIDGNFDGKVAWDIGAYEFNSFRPPRFAVQPQLTADGWKLNITGAANQWVHVQRSSNLKDWEEIWSGWMGAEGAHQCNDGDTSQKAMFYRVVVP
jgi:hypothetical protein